MGLGIQICGLNGSGKSTIGKALAKALGAYFIDSEDLFFPEADNDTYSKPRSREEAERLLMEKICEHSEFVFASVKGNYGNEIVSKYDYVIVVDVPKDVRMRRIRNRSFEKFGNRMTAGGDLFEREEAFFQMAQSRQDDYIENWLQNVTCPILRVDGTLPIPENIEKIINFIKK